MPVGDGIAQVSEGIALLTAIEGLPPWQDPRWSDLGFPVIDRGRHAIFPLALAALAEREGSTTAGLLVETADHLRTYCVHFYGGDFFHSESMVDTDEGYGRRVIDAGPVLPDPGALTWWEIGRTAVLLVRSIADDENGASETLALHALPKEWVARLPSSGTKREASRARRMAREQSEADASWSWEWRLAVPAACDPRSRDPRDDPPGRATGDASPTVDG